MATRNPPSDERSQTATPEIDQQVIITTMRQLEAALAALLDPMDIPGSWTPRQREAYETRRQTLDAHRRGIQQQVTLLAKPKGRIAHWTPIRDRMLAAKATIEQQRDAAPDWRTIPDARERDLEWGKQEARTAALKAIRHGVEFMHGEPCLPNPLRELLTDTCGTCKHSTLAWHGPLPAMEQLIAEAETTIADESMRLASYLQTAERLLAAEARAETVTV